MRPAAHCNIPDRAPDMRTKHAYAQHMRHGCCERLRPCARPHSRAHCLCQTPDLRYLPKEHKQGTGMRCERGGVPSTASPAQEPICPASERRKRDPGPSRALSGSTLLPWPKSAQNRANAQQWSRGRVRGLIYWLVQPSAPHGLRILCSSGCSRSVGARSEWRCSPPVRVANAADEVRDKLDDDHALWRSPRALRPTPGR